VELHQGGLLVIKNATPKLLHIEYFVKEIFKNQN
jgi:hypothetical protein